MSALAPETNGTPHAAKRPAMERTRARAVRLETRWRWPAAVLLLLLAFAADELTGSEVASSLYYLVAVAFAAWWLGRGAGIAMAALSGVAWFTAYLVVGQPYSHPSVLVWNLFAEVTTYVGSALVIAALHDHVQRTAALAERLQRSNLALEREMAGVGKLQRELLPAGTPALPGYRWAVHYETSTRASGDYYDFIPLPDGRLGILVADASGHGAPAAVLMAMTRTLMRAIATKSATPDAALGRLSARLAALVPAGAFVTACYVVLNPEGGELSYALAGHDAPFIVRPAPGAVERLPQAGGPPLGLFADLGFDRGTARLEPGDALVLHTDGLTECFDPRGRLLGEAAVREAIEASPSPDPDAIAAQLIARVTAHRGGAAAADDLTFLVLGRAPAAAPAVLAAPARVRASGTALPV